MENSKNDKKEQNHNKRLDRIKAIVAWIVFLFLALVGLFSIVIPGFYGVKLFKGQVINDITVQTSDIITYSIGLLSLFIGFLTIAIGAIALFGYSSIKAGAENTAAAIATKIADREMKKYFTREQEEQQLKNQIAKNFPNLVKKNLSDKEINIILAEDSNQPKESDQNLEERESDS